jgi:ribosomal protein L16 Arg81 hydroxylase
MNYIMHIYKIILFIILIILIIHTIYTFKVNNELNIIQINNPSKNILEDNFRKKSPMIITGMLEKWNFIDKMKLKNLKTQKIKIKINNSIIEQNKTKIIYKTLEEYLNWIENLEKNKDSDEVEKYVLDNSINVYCAENENLLQEMNILGEVKEESSMLLSPLSLVNTYPVWIGHSHSKTGLHYDTDYRNLLCQIEGQKKIYLFSPDQTQYLYPSNKFDNGAVCSQVDFWNIDNKKFPEFNKSSYIEILLSPGQIFSIPPYWWHAVENIGTNVAISIRSEPFSTVLAKIPSGLSCIMHNLGLYKSNNCTCCNSEN